MKVAILQWVYDNRVVGTIERISTTGADLCCFLQKQMEVFGLNEFQTGLPVGDPAKYSWNPTVDIQTMSELQRWIQDRLDADMLDSLQLLGTRSGESYEDFHHWWRIQIRNLHLEVEIQLEYALKVIDKSNIRRKCLT